MNVAQGADLASAATVNLGAATGNFVKITGSTAITSFGTATAGVTRSVMFTGALTLTYNATAMILPTGVSIATAVGDTAEFTSLGSGNWVCTSYVRASGAPLGNAGLAAKLNPSAVLDVAYSQTSGNSANYNHPG